MNTIYKIILNRVIDIKIAIFKLTSYQIKTSQNILIKTQAERSCLISLEKGRVSCVTKLVLLLAAIFLSVTESFAESTHRNTTLVSAVGNGIRNGSNERIGSDKYEQVGTTTYALDQANFALNQKVDTVSDGLDRAFRRSNAHIDDVAQKTNAGIAAALALEAAPFVAGKYTYSAGTAYHDNGRAVGMTLRKTSDNGMWSISGGVATASQGDPSVRIGMSGVID